MNHARLWQWVLFSVVLGGLAVACASPTPTINALCSYGDPLTVAPNAQNTVCVPLNDNVSGTFAFTTRGGTSGNSLKITAVTSGAPSPQAARRDASATALTAWSFTVGPQPIDALAPTISLSGLGNPSSLVVELIQPANLSPTVAEETEIFTYNAAQSTASLAAFTANSMCLGQCDAGNNTGNVLSDCSENYTPTFSCYIEVVSGSVVLASPTPTPTPTTTPSSAAASGVIVTTSGGVNQLANTGATPAPTFTLSNGASITWGSATGEPAFFLTGSNGSTVNITYSNGQAPNGCTPPAQNGGTVKAVILSAEFSGWVGSDFQWVPAPSNLFTTTPTLTATAPSGTYYGLLAAEGTCSGAQVVTANGPPTSNGVFTLGLPQNAVNVNTANTYVIEIWYQ
ncbi:MAG TPA: hypothetical protein VK702_13270 [Candidatus Acidoferrum sp.]|jgi:hypothetical protein|nr:hypothetical protein [Candidatus Acidoferrum sp.]